MSCVILDAHSEAADEKALFLCGTLGAKFECPCPESGDLWARFASLLAFRLRSRALVAFVFDFVDSRANGHVSRGRDD